MKFNNNITLRKFRKALLSSNAFFNRNTVLSRNKLFNNAKVFGKDFDNPYIMIITLCLLSLALILLFLFWTSPYDQLIIEEAATNKALWRADIKADEWFSQQYIHSVEKSLVIEKFKVDENGTIYVMESWTGSYGAGLPSGSEGHVEMIDGFHVIKDINKPTPMLNMIPSHLYPHTFHFRDEVIYLSEPPFRRKHLRIKVERVTWFTWLLN